jgi:hypothetical protein
MICYNHDIRVLSRWRNSRIMFLVTFSLVWLFQCQKYSGCKTLTSIDPLPMVVTVMNSKYLKFIFSAFFVSLGIWNFVGCTTSAPDRSSPRGYSRKKLCLSIDSKIFAPCFPRIVISCIKFLFFSSGMRSTLPIEVAPKAMGGFLRNNHSLRSFLWLIILSTLLGIRDVIDIVILCDYLTGRWPLHMGNAVISQIFRPLVGLPLLIRVPCRGPCSFLKKLYI